MLVQVQGQTAQLVGREPAQGAGKLLDVRGAGDVVSPEMDVKVVPQVRGVPAVGAGEERLAGIGRGNEVVETQGIFVRALEILQFSFWSLLHSIFVMGLGTSSGTWGLSRDFF